MKKVTDLGREYGKSYTLENILFRYCDYVIKLCGFSNEIELFACFSSRYL